MKKPIRLITRLGLLLLTNGCVAQSTAATARDVPVQTGKRWLEVQQVRGKVTYKHGQQKRPASVGDRLQAVGDGITTDRGSSATLAVENSNGKVLVAANTNLQVKTLATRADGSKVTILSVTRGQIRLQVRSLKNSNSTFRVETPAGVAGVRGTVFGVSVDPNGKTAISTLQGSVEVTGQDQTVEVSSGNSALLISGKAPQPPQLTSVKLNMKPGNLSRTGSATIEVQGQIDPLNSVFLNGEHLETDAEGNFKLEVPQTGRLRFLVRSPLGYERVYEYGIR